MCGCNNKIGSTMKFGNKKGKMFGIPVNRLAGVTAGAIGGKFINPMLKGAVVRFLPSAEDPTAPSKFGVIAVAGVKVLAGAYLNDKSKSQFVKDAGFGLMTVGGLELVGAVAPGLNLAGIGNLDWERVGVVEIDLDKVSGGSAYKSLENQQSVAGGVQDYAEVMELAGMEMY